jgi:hypothetical protein
MKPLRHPLVQRDALLIEIARRFGSIPVCRIGRRRTGCGLDY